MQAGRLNCQRDGQLECGVCSVWRDGQCRSQTDPLEQDFGSSGLRAVGGRPLETRKAWPLRKTSQG